MARHMTYGEDFVGAVGMLAFFLLFGAAFVLWAVVGENVWPLVALFSIMWVIISFVASWRIGSRKV